jgi:hypothetical protein
MESARFSRRMTRGKGKMKERGRKRKRRGKSRMIEGGRRRGGRKRRKVIGSSMTIWVWMMWMMNSSLKTR